jgi:6-pyruvoyltetrahydropterin/6-carboxytetrahydropterin synthase
MFEVEKTFSFEAGHVLDHHDGKCRHPHGHSYVLKVTLQADSLIPSGPKQNMILDFTDISSIVKPMIEKHFDHKWLNDSLNTESPTAEFIAYWIFHYLEPHLPGLVAITIFETATSSAAYRKGT